MKYSLRNLLIAAAIAPPLLAAAWFGIGSYFREAQAGDWDTMSWVGQGIAFAAAAFLILVVSGLLACWRTG